MTRDLRPAPKDLSGDSLFQLIRSRFDRLSDPRAREVEIPLGDALMSAFAMFSLKDPSLGFFAYPPEKVYSRPLPGRGCRRGGRRAEVTIHARLGEAVIGHERLDGCPVLTAAPQFEDLLAG